MAKVQKPKALRTSPCNAQPATGTAMSASSSSISIPYPAVNCGMVPDDAQCKRWWHTYGMLENVAVHSLLVAGIASWIGHRAKTRGLEISEQTLRAAGLLHDLAKTYTVRHGGNHSQLGAAWVMALTGNPAIAQAVRHHVMWPGPLDVRTHFVPLVIIYADKRVKHDQIVTLQERFSDLFDRYGINEARIASMNRSFAQVEHIEGELSTLLEVDLHAYPFDSRGMVQ
ncbi:HD domain-containing protein [Desulfovermiculus halophilus]|jgi:predicted hydrolase (HD superfamily)|uniref:HD domain-containing protein n=1 Tax=Desulfovermiculus halophilus TaxID=339722 RepID=UPI001FC9338E|nr:HD domain-containing protein [Desulfovermiculus halophilus]